MIARRAHVDRDTCPLGLTARLLWAELAGRADWDGTCSVSMQTLCRALGAVNRATVQRATAELVEYGVIDVVVAHGRGRQNTYRLELAPETNAARTRRLRPENAALVRENAAPGASYRGEVVREVVRERAPYFARCPRRSTSRTFCDAACPNCAGAGHVWSDAL
jgi:hypothetical protein